MGFSPPTQPYTQWHPPRERGGGAAPSPPLAVSAVRGGWTARSDTRAIVRVVGMEMKRRPVPSVPRLRTPPPFQHPAPISIPITRTKAGLSERRDGPVPRRPFLRPGPPFSLHSAGTAALPLRVAAFRRWQGNLSLLPSLPSNRLPSPAPFPFLPLLRPPSSATPTGCHHSHPPARPGGAWPQGCVARVI